MLCKFRDRPKSSQRPVVRVPPSVHRSPPCARAPPASNPKPFRSPKAHFEKVLKHLQFLYGTYLYIQYTIIYIFHKSVRKSFNLFQFVQSFSVTEPDDQLYIYSPFPKTSKSPLALASTQFLDACQSPTIWHQFGYMSF